MLHMSARRGAQFIPNWNTDYLLEDLSRKNHENCVYQKLKHLDDVIFRELVFGVGVFLYKVYFLWLKTIYLYLR